MRVLEALANRDHIWGRRMQVSGYLVAGFHLAYLVEDAHTEREGIQQPAILLPASGLADSLMNAGCPSFVGSMVVIAGQATITGCITPATGFSMFPAGLSGITNVKIAVDGVKAEIQVGEPQFAIALNPVTSLTVSQVRVLHQIVLPNQNHL